MEPLEKEVEKGYNMGKPIEPEPAISKKVKDFFKYTLGYPALVLAIPTFFLSSWQGGETKFLLEEGMTKTAIEQEYKDIDIYKPKFLGEATRIAGTPGRELVYLLFGTNE